MAADLLDVITLAEAKAALNPRTTAKDSQIEFAVTAASRLLDDLCGAVVARAVTERHDSVYSDLWLDHPVLSITSVTEYVSGTGTVLTAEDLTVDGGYLLDGSRITRRSGFANTTWGGTAVIVYQAGRYADTASVDRRFKWVAQEIVAANFKRQQGAGTQTYGEDIDVFSGLPVGLPRGVLEFIAAERRAPAIA